VLTALLLVLVLTLGSFWLWVESRINHVDALSGAADTPGRTYLIVGSDARDGWGDDGVEGARTDTIIILHKPVEGPTALISIPRDSYVEIPGRANNKINAAFAFGGAPLLVETVENLSGLTVDHYLEVGFLGVTDVVDALGGVELCLDQDVDDWRSDLQWEAGCHLADGDTALAFSRMRYSDPIGDIGRTQRQQQLVSAVAREASDPSTFLNPVTTVRLVDAGLTSLRVSDGTHAIDLARAAFAFKGAQSNDAVTGTPPLVSIGHHVDGVGSTVLLDADANAEFWRDIANGDVAPGTEVGGFG
jgi:LCP family protein required for cell wall assembly